MKKFKGDEIFVEEDDGFVKTGTHNEGSSKLRMQRKKSFSKQKKSSKVNQLIKLYRDELRNNFKLKKQQNQPYEQVLD